MASMRITHPERADNPARLWRRAGSSLTMPPTWWLRYGFGIAAAGLALAATYLLDSRLSQTPAPLLFAAVTLAAWYGGLGPALICTFLCAMGLDIFIETPLDPRGDGGSSFLYLLVFVLVAVLVSWLNERRRRAEAAMRTEADRLAILAEASRAFAAAVPNQETTLQAVVQQVVNALGDACVISLLSEDGRWLDHVAWHHRDPAAHRLMSETYASRRQGADEGMSGRALREERPFMIAAADPEEMRVLAKAEYAPLIQRFAIYSLLSIPLQAGAAPSARSRCGAVRQVPRSPGPTRTSCRT